MEATMRLMNVLKRGRVIASIPAASLRDGVEQAERQGISGIFHVVDTGKTTTVATPDDFPTTNPQANYKPKVGDRLVSNEGRGPLTARIVAINDKRSHMERTTTPGKRIVRFTLPTWFLNSRSCGWRLAEAHTAEDRPASRT